MNLFWRNWLGIFVAFFLIEILATGCTSESKAKLREKNAFLAGQNSVLQQQQAQTTTQTSIQSAGVMVVGAVQNPQVPWIAGLTLAQAIATANYVGQDQPKQIIITRNGESATMDASVLLNGTDIPLEIGDIIELR
jgi:hypothetical protein